VRIESGVVEHDFGQGEPSARKERRNASACFPSIGPTAAIVNNRDVGKALGRRGVVRRECNECNECNEHAMREETSLDLTIFIDYARALK
jgi:hypothetical protein